MADDFAAFAAKVHRLGDEVERLPRSTGHAVGKVGKDAVLDLERRVFGPDRKFSGARGSRKARRVATARYTILDDRVEVYPSGDPIYIFMRGRGRHDIRPRKVKALAFADGNMRAHVLGGRLAPREHLLDPAVEQISREAPKAIDKALADTIRKVI